MMPGWQWRRPIKGGSKMNDMDEDIYNAWDVIETFKELYGPNMALWLLETAAIDIKEEIEAQEKIVYADEYR